VNSAAKIMKNIGSANVLESFFPKNFYIRVFERARKGKIQKLAFSDQNTTNRLIIFISATKYVSFSPRKSIKNLI